MHGTETEKNVAKIDIGKISKLDNNIEFTVMQGVFSVPLPPSQDVIKTVIPGLLCLASKVIPLHTYPLQRDIEIISITLRTYSRDLCLNFHRFLQLILTLETI